MSVLVGGGSGFIGTALIKALKQSGHKTQIISRNAGPDGRLSWLVPDGHVETVELMNMCIWGNISKDGLPNDCFAVINLAGANVANFFRRWPTYKTEVYDSRIKTTKMLADAIVNSPNKPKVFITTSAVGYYPPSHTEIYTEESPGGGPENFFTNMCRDWEAAGNLPPDAPTRRVIPRLGLVMGRQGGVVQQTVLPFSLGLGGPLGGGQQWMPWVHIDDVIGIFMHALNNDSVTGVLNAVAPKFCTSKEWAQAYGRAMWRPAVIPVPEWYLKLVFSPERAALFTASQRVSPKRTLESGYHFKYPDIDSAAREFAHVF